MELVLQLPQWGSCFSLVGRNVDTEAAMNEENPLQLIVSLCILPALFSEPSTCMWDFLLIRLTNNSPSCSCFAVLTPWVVQRMQQFDEPWGSLLVSYPAVCRTWEIRWYQKNVLILVYDRTNSMSRKGAMKRWHLFPLEKLGTRSLGQAEASSRTHQDLSSRSLPCLSLQLLSDSLKKRLPGWLPLIPKQLRHSVG